MDKKEKKIILIILVAWLLIPTGTPDDVITFWIIGQLGLPLYIFVVIAILYTLWHNGITVKKAHKTAKSFAMGVMNGKI